MDGARICKKSREIILNLYFRDLRQCIFEQLQESRVFPGNHCQVIEEWIVGGQKVWARDLKAVHAQEKKPQPSH